MAEKVGDAYVDVYFDGDSPNSRRSKRRLFGLFKKDGEQAGKEFNDGFEDSVSKEQAKSAQNITRHLRSIRWGYLGDRSGREYGSALGDRAVAEFKRRVDAGSIRLKIDDSGFKVALQDLDRMSVSIRNINRDTKQWGEGFSGPIRQLRRINNRLSRTGDTVGRVFGRGSRNDLIHFFGGLVQGGYQLVTLFPRMIGGVAEFGQSFTRLFSEARQVQGIFGSLATAFRGSVGSLAGFGSAMASAAVAIPAVVLVVGTLVAALSMLAAILVALASTIVYAAIGALSALAGAVAPVAFGIGVLVAAVVSMSDEMKEATKKSIKPFVDGMKDIGRSAADAIFGGEQFTQTIQHMTEALTSPNMKDLVTGIATAIGNVGNQWAASLNSPGFQNWLKAMGQTIPGQIEGMGRVFANVVGAMGNTLLALQPTVDRFVGWLERITSEWQAWTSSSEGQEAMLSFFDEAVESAKSLGNFLGEVTGLFADLFSAGRETGDSIFDDMTNSIKRFRAYISDGGLERWFADAAEFATSLGRAIKGLAEVFDVLDNDVTRFLAKNLMGVLKGLFEGLAITVAVVVDTIKFAFGALLATLATALKALISPLTAIDGLLGMLGLSIPGIDGLNSSLRDMADVGAELMDFEMTRGVLESFGVSASEAGVKTRAAGGDFLSAAEGADSLSRALTEVKENGDIVVTVDDEQTTLSAFRMNQPGGLMYTMKEFSNTFWKIWLDDNSVVEAGANLGLVGADLEYISGTTWDVNTGLPQLPQNQINLDNFWSSLVRITGQVWDTTTATPNLPANQAAANNFFATLQSIVTPTWTAVTTAPNLPANQASASSLFTTLQSINSSFVAKVSEDGVGPTKSSVNSLLTSLQSITNKPWIVRAALGGAGGTAADGGMLFGNGLVAKTRKMAAGGELNYAQMYRGVLTGEAGRELIVPLDRPLGAIDSSVRALAAIAQGKASVGSSSRNVVVEAGAISIAAPDPWRAANEMLNQIAERIDA